MKRLLCLLLGIMLLMLALPASAQGTFNIPRESGGAYVLSTAGDALQLAQFNQNFGGTIDIDYHPTDPLRWARVDNVGIIRFVDPANPTIAEGVYTFAPFFEGFSVFDAAENKFFVREVEWSPDGSMIAFRIQNEVLQDLNQGVWFWQPIRELSTDPSYQILRHCPPFCTAAGTIDANPGWRAQSLEWSSDSETILITLNLLGENRRGLELRYARRDRDQAQAGTSPNVLRYDYGHWANDGQRLVVSGRGPDETVVFGTTDRTNSVVSLTPASDIGMAWVQDAVQTPDNTLIMLGNTSGFGAPLQIVNGEGDVLTPPIGDAPPQVVKWSPNRTAVLLQTADKTYVAQVDGTIYEITALLSNNSPNIDWIDAPLPAELTRIALPEPLVEGEFSPETTPDPNATFNVGDLLTLNKGTLDIYAEPIGDAPIVGTLTPGEELIITGGPLEADDATWYRIQTITYTGWIRNTDNLTSG